MERFLKFRNISYVLLIFFTAFAITSCQHGDDSDDGNNGDKEDPHVVRDGSDLYEDPDVLSPPIVEQPLYTCGKTVVVKGFIPGAKIEIFANGITIGGDVSDSPSGQVFNVSPALTDGQIITAKQIFDVATSEPSNEVTVKDHTEDYPSGVPQPYIDPPPLYNCGKATGVRDVVEGSHLKVYSETAIPAGGFEPKIVVGENNSSGAAQSVGINPEFKTDNRITAQYFVCEDESPPLKEDSPVSLPHIVVDEPAVIPHPTVDEPVYAGATRVTVRNILNGAVIEVLANGAKIGGQATSGGTGQVVRIDPAIAVETITATQTLCTPSGPSPGVTVKECDELPAAKIKQPEPGDEQIVVTEFVDGSRIIIFANGKEIGDGGGPLIQLIRPMQIGEEIKVVQRLGDCESQWIYVIPVGCSVFTYLPDPDSSGPYAVGSADYGPNNTGNVVIDGETLRIWGTVRYPAVADGEGAEIIASPTQLPIVFFIHGWYYNWRDDEGDWRTNTDHPGAVEIPNHEGYVYVMESLARKGFISVSVNANDLNPGGYHIPTRGKLLLEHISRWKAFNDPGQPDPIFEGRFHNRVNLRAVGIAGHSRGGEAVIHAALDNNDPDISIKSVLSIAPMDAHRKTLNEIPLLVILPAADGDVIPNDGARIYDRAGANDPDSWFKSQMYIYGANHNNFNSEWLYLDSLQPNAGPDMMTRANQEAMLKSWAVAFFSLTLNGEESYRPVFEGTTFFEELENHRVYSSYKRAIARGVDNYEDAPANQDKNSLTGNVPYDPDEFMTFGEYDLRNDNLGIFDPYGNFNFPVTVFNDSFYEDTKGLVVRWDDEEPSFTSEIPKNFRDNSRYDVLSVRIGQVNDPKNSPNRLMNLRVGLIDDSGKLFDTSIINAGEVPYPYAHVDGAKSMVHTYRIPISCFTSSDGDVVNAGDIRSVRFIFDKTNQGTLAIDQLEFSD